MPKLVKRYANRKLYDTESSTYITLENIEEMVREGEDVRIIDNSTGEDITSATLAHIVLDQQRSNPAFPVSVLRGIIQSGEEFFNRLQWPVTQFRDEFKRRAEALEEGGKAIREFVDGTQRSLDDMQRRLDERFQCAGARNDKGEGGCSSDSRQVYENLLMFQPVSQGEQFQNGVPDGARSGQST